MTVRTADRTLDIFESFARRQRPITVSDLARELIESEPDLTKWAQSFGAHVETIARAKFSSPTAARTCST